jgi:hypothetical protein
MRLCSFLREGGQIRYLPNLHAIYTRSLKKQPSPYIFFPPPAKHLARRFWHYFPPLLIYIILFTSTSVYLVYFSFFLRISLFTSPFSYFFFPLQPGSVIFPPEGGGGVGYFPIYIHVNLCQKEFQILTTYGASPYWNLTN